MVLTIVSLFFSVIAESFYFSIWPRTMCMWVIVREAPKIIIITIIIISVISIIIVIHCEFLLSYRTLKIFSGLDCNIRWHSQDVCVLQDR